MASPILRGDEDAQRRRQLIDSNTTRIRGPTDFSVPAIHVHSTSEPSESSDVVIDDGLLLLEEIKQSESVQFGQDVIPGSDILAAASATPHGLNLDHRLRHTLRECKGDEGKHFMPIDDLDIIISHDTIEIYLSALGQAKISNRLQEITSYICGNRDGSQDLHTGKRVFASLVLANRADAVTMFYDEGVRDEDLPLIPTSKSGSTFRLKRKNMDDSILTCFNGWEERDIQLFDKHQLEMKPPFFAQGKNSRPLHYNLSDRSCLPWTSYGETIHSSKSSDVRRIGIHPSQHRLQPKGGDLFALRTLKSEKRREEFKLEVEALKKIRPHSNLVTLLATLHYKGEYHLLFPWAEGGNLLDLWQHHDPEPSLEGDWMLWLVEQCCGLAEGLSGIHGASMHTSELAVPSDLKISIPGDRNDGRDYGRHGDIKPQNILWFRQERNRHGHGVLKLSGFGMTMFHSELTTQVLPEKVKDITQSYAAPEYELDNSISRPYDIWSLGCIFIEFITWAIFRFEGVQEFRDNRKADRDNRSNFELDNFYHITHTGLKTQRPKEAALVKTSVRKWVAHLRNQRTCRWYLGNFLGYISINMIKTATSKRHNCYQVIEHLRSILQQWTKSSEYRFKNLHNVTSLSKPRQKISGDDGDVEDDSNISSDGTTSALYTVGKRFEAEIVAKLVASLSKSLYDAEGVKSVTNASPDHLEAFTRKLGAEQEQGIYREVIRHVYRNRLAIISGFRESIVMEFQGRRRKSVGNEKLVSYREKVGGWLSSVSSHHIQDQVFNNAAIEGEGENEGGDYDVEEDENNNEAIPPELEAYLTVVTSSTAYDWLLSKLRHELLFYVPGEVDARDMISKEVLSHSIFLRASQKSGPPRCEVLYETDWDPLAFFEEQNYHGEDYYYSEGELFSRVLVLAGLPNEVEGLSCGEYLCQTWPHTGKAFLELMEMHLGSDGKRESRFTLKDGTELVASPGRSRLSLTASGLPDTVIEIGQQLAWVSSALCSSHFITGAVARPIVERTIKKEQTENSITLNIQLRCQQQLLTDSPQEISSGECWRHLFRKPMIVQGFPIQRRVQGQTGLEMDLATMGLLARGHRISTFDGYLIIKGYRTMLVAVKVVGDMVLWHVLTKEDGGDIEYHDPRVRQFDPQIDCMVSWSQLKNMRHVVGWCSNVKSHTGATESSFNLLSGSGLEGPGLKFALERISIGFTKYVTGSVSLLATRETPLRFGKHDGYQDQISSMASQYAVLFDVHTRRGWLLDGATVLLHVLRSSLMHNKNKNLRPFQNTLDILFESKLGDGGIASSPVEFLTDMRQMNLELYDLPDEQKIETKTPLQRGKPTFRADSTETSTRTSYRVKDRVIRIYSVLDEIFSYHRQNATIIKASPLTQLEGLEYGDMAKMSSYVSPKYIHLMADGKGWVDLIRALRAVTFFGSGFGDILEPVNSVSNDSPSITVPSPPQKLCKSWKYVPHGHEFLATTISTLKDILKESGGMHESKLTPQQPWKLAPGIYIDSPDRVFESCQCENAAGSGGKATKLKPPCDRVLAALSESHVARRDFRTPERLPEQGAVIFGVRRARRLLKNISGDPIEAKAKSVTENEVAGSQSNGDESSTTARRLDPSTATTTQQSAISSGNSNMLSPATPVSGDTSVADLSDFPIVGGKQRESNSKGVRGWVKKQGMKSWKRLRPGKET